MASVVSYKVGSTRAVKVGPVRCLTLQLGAPEGGVTAVSMFFYEKDPSKLGFVNRTTGLVVVNLPLRDFHDTYKIVNAEKPIFVHWRTDPEEDRLLSVDVSTTDEPVGEGLADNSP